MADAIHGIDEGRVRGVPFEDVMRMQRDIWVCDHPSQTRSIGYRGGAKLEERSPKNDWERTTI